jgi:hypothetical protein
MFRQFSRNSFTIILLFSILVLLISCTDTDKKNGNNTDPDNIYFDYEITAAEGNDNLTVLLQFRVGGEEGDAVSVGNVSLDGEMMTLDSSKMSGAFYELHKPLIEFAGKHTILFTGINKKEYKEEFNFQPVELITQLPDSIKRGEMNLEFEGLDPEDYLRVLLTDTSFINDGINRVDTVNNGQLFISQSDLVTLANGPVQLQFIREYERPVKNGTKSGGRLLITYRLQREILLME